MPDARLSLEGRVALVTGSTTGLGKAIAMELAGAGARVGLNFAHNVGRADSALREMRQHGWVGALFQADVTRETEVRRLMNECRATLGPVDILVINATSDQPQRPVEEYDWAFVQQMLDYFVKSPFLLVQACLPHMTVNMIAPGWIPVERHAEVPQAEKDAYLAGVPAKRWGIPEDVAAAALYLTSEGASFVTGQTLHVNGGLSAKCSRRCAAASAAAPITRHPAGHRRAREYGSCGSATTPRVHPRDQALCIPPWSCDHG
jgi:3-oxoacyl-[acyl-carrier protein] reductase